MNSIGTGWITQLLAPEVVLHRDQGFWGDLVAVDVLVQLEGVRGYPSSPLGMGM